MLVIENVTGDTGGVVAYPKEDVPLILGCVFIERVPILDGYLRAAIIFIQVKVHHARNRVRAVGGRSAIFQNVNALDRRDGNGSQINETIPGVGSPRERSNATTVDQHQRGAWIQTAQRDCS